MNGRSELISKLQNSTKFRASYIRSKLNVLIPSQLRGLRLKGELTQQELAEEAEMKQPRISAMERPGALKFNLETLIRMAAAHKVGMVVKFVSLSEMLEWENNYSQDKENVTRLEHDTAFLYPVQAPSLVAAGAGMADLIVGETPWSPRFGEYVLANPEWDVAAQYRQAFEGHADLKVEVKSVSSPESAAMQTFHQSESVRNLMVESSSTPIWSSVNTAEENQQHA